MENDSISDQLFSDNELECYYSGTDFLEVKIYLIGVFAAILAVISFFFNAFFTCVFILCSSLRRSPLYYFGVLAALDAIMAINYLALMAVPVYMDQFQWLWLYHVFLLYLRPMLTLSNCALFASVLMILLATVERFLRTFQSENLHSLRRFLERRRPQVCLCLIVLAIAYKICTYFEIDIMEHKNCEDWMKFEIQQTEIARNPDYRFWWVFVARNLIDRIIPFFALVLMNFLIVRTLKREHKRSNEINSPLNKPNRFQAVASIAVKSKRIVKHTRKSSKLKRALSRNASSIEDNINKKNLKDATRALLAIVMMYLMSQTLQVIITFVEAFWKNTLEEEYTQLYSFINDLMSILTLLSSALRYPVYYAISSPISQASHETLLRLFRHSKSVSIKAVTTPSNAIRLLNNENNNETAVNKEDLLKFDNNQVILSTPHISHEQNQFRNNHHQCHTVSLLAGKPVPEMNCPSLQEESKNYSYGNFQTYVVAKLAIPEDV